MSTSKLIDTIDNSLLAQKISELKMTKSGKNKNKTETEPETKSIQDQLLDLEKTFNDKSNLDPMIQAIFLMVKGIYEQKQIESEKVQILQNEVETLNKKIIELEFFSTKEKVRIQNLPFHENSKKQTETAEQSRTVFSHLLSHMGVDDIEIKDAYRIKLENNKNAKPAPMIVTFSSETDKSEFFKSLKLLKGNKKFNIRVSHEYPKSLKEKLKVLQDTAYTLRQKNYQTSIRYQQADLKLFFKKKGKKYQEYSE